MPNRSKGTSISYGKRRKRAIEEYLSLPVPIQDNNTDQLFTPAEDEGFVPLFHYKKPNLTNRRERIGEQSNIYIVSNRGNVISFDIPDQPVVLKKTPTDRNRAEMSYLKCGDNWDIHKLVWFSFAADAIINNKELPAYYRIHESFWTLEGLVELSELGSPEFGKVVVVHHIDLNPQNNNLENLELLPNNTDDKVSEGWHSWIHTLRNKPDAERMNAIIENKKISKATIIELDGNAFISEFNQQKIEAKNLEIFTDIRWKILINILIKNINEKIGDAFFSEPRYGFIEFNDSIKSIMISKTDTGSDYNVEYAEFRNNSDYDFIYRDGMTWLPKVQND